MRTAILITGHIRTWLECKSNFLESFQDLAPDVFVSTYDLQYNYHPAGRHWMGTFSDQYLAPEEIKQLFNGINVIEFDIEAIDDVMLRYTHDNEHNIHTNFKEECHTVLQYQKIIKALNLMLTHEVRSNFKYDLIIKLRSDIYHKKFKFVVEPATVVVSDKNVFPNDVIIAANRDEFLNIFNFIRTEFYTPIYNDSHLHAPHNLLLSACKFYNYPIKQFDIMDYVVRRTGKNYYSNM